MQHDRLLLNWHRRHGLPDGTMYGQVMSEDAAEIVEEHLEKGKVVERLALIEHKSC